MSRIRTLRMTLPCPGCRVSRRLVAGCPDNQAGRSADAVLRECAPCWSRRALALNEERARLRASGELVQSGRRMAWHGALLRNDSAPDGLEGALVSALLRRGMEPMPMLRMGVRHPETVEAESATER